MDILEKYWNKGIKIYRQNKLIIHIIAAALFIWGTIVSFRSDPVVAGISFTFFVIIVLLFKVKEITDKTAYAIIVLLTLIWLAIMYLHVLG